MYKANPREKFVDLAEKRVTKALEVIRLVGNLSNRSNYSYVEKDVVRIHDALQGALDEMKRRFDNGGYDDNVCFKL